MIKIRYTSTKTRRFTHSSLALVAQDVHLWMKTINKIYKLDAELPCPEAIDDDTPGVANESELWFGRNYRGGYIDLRWDRKEDIYLDAPDDPALKLLFQLTVLSLCEQFIYCKILETDEDFSRAIKIYENSVGSISDNAARDLGVGKRS